MKTEFWVTNFAAPGRAGRIAKLYEDAGWDGLLFTDSQHHNGDVYQSLALASVATKRIGLGTGVTNPLTRNAAVTAAAILSVQVESNGRAILVPVGHKFGHVFYAAASKGCSLARARSMRCSNESRSLRVNFHSKGWAMAS